MEKILWQEMADARRTGFVRAWHVFDSYRIQDGLIGPDPKSPSLARLYAPITHSELPNVLAKLHEGTDKDVLRFVESYGLLGYSELAPDSTGEPERYGDPLRWVRQHARTVRFIMDVWRLVQDEDESGLQSALAELSGLPTTVTFAAGRSITRRFFTLGPKHPDRDIFALTRYMVLSIINSNLEGIGPVVSEAETSLHLRFSYDALIQVIYYQLAVAVTGGRMQRCAAKDCKGLFIQHDPRQRFCPPWLGAKGESLCSLRERQRTLWERRRLATQQKKESTEATSARKAGGKRTAKKGTKR